MMYNTQLDTFLKVAELGSFNKAADALYITPPAVTKQINLLEEDLGVTLFVRSHRGLKLTPAGQSFCKDAKYIIDYCEASLERAKCAMIADSKVVRIGISPMTPQPLVNVWPKIQQECADIKFQLVPFFNTPENAREILKNLGQNIDVVGGIFDDTLLDLRQCAGTQLAMVPICCAVALHHPLAQKDHLEVSDLYGQNFMLMRRGWSHHVDELRDDLWKNHPQVRIVDFDFYSVDVFNKCGNDGALLMAIPQWQQVHPMLKILPVNWNHEVPYGLLHAEKPTLAVKQFITAMQKALAE